MIEWIFEISVGLRTMFRIRLWLGFRTAVMICMWAIVEDIVGARLEI